MIELTDKDLIYLWDALFSMSTVQMDGCSNIGGIELHHLITDKINAEMKKRGLS